MNFFPYSCYFMYYALPINQIGILQTPPVTYAPQISNIPQENPTFTQLNATQKELELFLNKLKHLHLGKSNIAYMELNAKINYESLPNLEQFKGIYSGGINRYKETYKGSEKKVNWSKEDTLVLLWILDKYSKLNKKPLKELKEYDWNQISKMMPFRSGQDCMFKFLSLKKNKLQIYPWTNEEQNYLFNLIEVHQMINWVSIAKKLFEAYPKVYRSPKQCREHWGMHLNSLHQRCKKSWIKQEDLALLQLYEKQGRRWKHISKFLPGRSQNAIKNRFSLLIQKYYSEGDDEINQLNKVKKIKQKIIKRGYDEKKRSSGQNHIQLIQHKSEQRI